MSRSRAAVSALVLTLAGTWSGSARAQGRKPQTPRPAWLAGTPPASWTEAAGLGRSVATALVQSAPFGAHAARGGAVAHVHRGAGAFYLSWLESDQAATAPAEAARGALDRLRESRLVSSPEAHSTEEVRYEEGVEGGLAEARLEWRHVSNETLSLVRAFVWLSRDGKLRLAAAECVASTTAGKPPPAVEKACRDALASVAVTLAPPERGELGALPASRASTGGERLALGEEAAADQTAAEAAAEQAAADQAAAGSQPTVGPVAPGSEGRVLYRGPEPPEDQDGTRAWLIAIGAALVLGASYMTMRRLRSAGERSEPEAKSFAPDENDPGPETTDER